jgi:hypothetical protein
MSDNEAPKTYVIAARITEGSDADRIYHTWKATGWKPQEFIVHAIQSLDGVEPCHKDSIELATLGKLQELVNKLEGITTALESGGVITAQQRQDVSDVIEAELPPELKANLRRMKRPGLKAGE